MAESILRIRSLSGDTLGKTWSTTKTMHVGRTPGLPLHINDTSVSRWHAELALTSSGWTVRDTGSSNGSFLNGQQLSAEAQRLQTKDILQFGNVTLIVEAAFVAKESRGPVHKEYRIESKLLLDWDDLVDVESQMSTKFPKGCLSLLMRTGRAANEMRSPHDCLPAILWAAAEYFAAEHAAILTVGEDACPLAVREALDLGPALDQEWYVSHPLVLEAFRTGKSILGRDSKVCSVLALLLRTESENRLGVLVFARDDANRPYQQQDLLLADALSLGVSVSIQNFQKYYHRYQGACSSILDILTKIAHWQSPGIREEHQRVTQVALLLAGELELPEHDVHCLRLAIPLRNIGMLGLKQDLLNKNGDLSSAEKAHVKKHILRGIETLEGASWMSPLIPIIRNCHERWDGSGYPDGLKGETIPILARILQTADAFGALMEDRPYRKRFTLDGALAEICVNKGTQFDPACVDAILRVRNELEATLLSHAEIAETMSYGDFKKSSRVCREQKRDLDPLGDTVDGQILTAQLAEEV